MNRVRPKLFLLDDWEGRIRSAPGARRLAELAELTVLDRPLAEVPDEDLADVRVVLAIRERTRFDRATFDRLPNLELILQTGGHAYHIDLAEAERRGIAVALWRSHDACEAAMRELTFALAVAALRRFPEATRAGDGGQWPGLLGGTLRGRRLGILGMGLQGRAVARLAQAFDMDVVAWARPGGSTDAADGIPRLPMEELLATSDVVSIHLRLSDESRGLLTAERLRSMKPGSVLVNTARGAIVDEDALVEVLRNGPLRAAGLDVFAHEPLPADSPLRSLPNVVLTPHIGWTVEEAFAEFAEGAAGQLEDYLAGKLDPAELRFPLPADRGRPDLVGGVAR
ncbi:2-hydroxyacid dehydrogenase [Amycolatopsis deserti]|uniref:2-hydroxyacid dehydrogenase n=1 Tax=Amycolatopsis deserti TaxID=185696 RepID=A0ABQ3JGZ6_9PSEU|nr:NAD(P)-dependent oxidoreductase [Amycolatopsis deserti]GHF18707.1 2-hydroxyacid dehydrogenase [Amycolatopsis deserti]